MKACMLVGEQARPNLLSSWYNYYYCCTVCIPLIINIFSPLRTSVCLFILFAFRVSSFDYTARTVNDIYLVLAYSSTIYSSKSSNDSIVTKSFNKHLIFFSFYI